MCSFLWLAGLPGLGAKVTAIEVESEGRGKSLQIAVNSALVEAIAQVNGRSLSSVTELNNLESSTTHGSEETYYASDKYQQQVRAATAGVVSGYEILQRRNLEDGQIQVALRVKVSKYEKSQKASRKRIAVLPFFVTSDHYLLSGTTVSAGTVTRNLDQELVNYLVQSRKFTVLDRGNIKQSMGELELAKSAASPTEELARLGQRLVADYILVGVIEQFKAETLSRMSKFDDMEFKTTTGTVHINYRLIEVATQQVVISDSPQLNFDAKQLGASAKSFDPKFASSRMIDDTTKKIAADILNQIYPVAVIALDGDTLVLGQGGKSLQSGERYKVYRTGEHLYDPYTKEYLGRSENYCCEVEIIRVAPKQSYARLVSGETNLAEIFEAKRYILRERVSKPRKSTVDNAAQSEAKPKSIQKLREEQSSGDDW